MTVNMRLRVLSGILLSFIWIGANLAFASAESAPPSVLAQSLVVATPVGLSSGPPSTQAIQRPTSVHASLAATTQPITSSTPTLIAAGIPDVPATGHPTPTQPAPERNPLRSPTTTSPSPASGSSVSQDPLRVQYPYYDKGPHITTLQMELGMKSVDGTYGPNTRRAHVEALGGPSAAVIIFYPELFETPTPCSHGCIPGDSHYLLPTLGELINRYFLPEDRELAQKIAFCESSGRTWHIGSDVVSHAYAIGWFQHLAKYWPERSEKAGWGDYHPFHAEANVAVAAWLYYTSGVHHWNPSRACWGTR